METRKLYYEDPFQKGFATTVVSCDEVKGGYAVVLAETAFYPEGGGQPYDTAELCRNLSMRFFWAVMS